MGLSGRIVSSILYAMVGIVSLVMAWKNLFGRDFVPFHEKVAGKKLRELDRNIQNVVLALMKTTGLGFLVVGMLLLGFPVMTHFRSDKIIELGIPLICGLYCFGLFSTNYHLYMQSGTNTPWKGSLIAVALIAIGMTLSVL